MKTKQIYLFFFTCLFSIACRDNNNPDVSAIAIQISIDRFDEAIEQLEGNDLPAKAPRLKRQFGAFYQDYMAEMLRVGNTMDASYYKDLRTVFQTPDYKALKEEVGKVYPDVKDAEDGLTDAFKHVLYYFPKTKIPKVITFFSGFAYQTVIGNGYIGIGLDLFLGANSKFYPALRETMPLYLSKRYTPENIVPRVMEAFIREELFPERDEDVSLISKMIYNGKVMFLMDKVMPDLEDSLKIGYDTRQLEWSKKYEPDTWAFFMNENLLYETDFMKIQKYLNEAPFTPGLGFQNEASPKLGIWIGWQIVKHYMERNPGISVQQLMAETDFQKILNGSKYKP